MKCPQCGQGQRVRVDIITTALVYPGGGIGEEDGDWNFGEESWARCPECAYEGTVRDFDVWNEKENNRESETD